MNNLFLRIRRYKISHQFKRDPKVKAEWWNNDAHSCMDLFQLYDYEDNIFETHCQSVSNIPTGRYQDTIATGPFQIKCFLEQRSFHCPVHGICNTADIEGQWINEYSVEKNDSNRWLIHDDQSLKPKPSGMITRIPWSAGCFVLHKSDFEAFNKILLEFNIVKNEMIDGELLEI